MMGYHVSYFELNDHGKMEKDDLRIHGLLEDQL